MEILTAIITGGLALLGVIVTNFTSNKKIEHQLDKQQAVMDCKIENLTAEVREHNNFAMRIPVIDEQIKTINLKISNIEKEINK